MICRGLGTLVFLGGVGWFFDYRGAISPLYFFLSVVLFSSLETPAKWDGGVCK